MASYFSGRWCDGKPYQDKDGEEHTSNRLVARQPLMFDENEDNPTFNLRKLSELPLHLCLAEEYKQLKDEVLCNFEFLLAHLRAKSLDDVLEDFEMYLKDFPNDSEMEIMQECLKISAVALSIEPKQLATQILGRMMHFQKKSEEYPFLCKVLQEAYNSSVPCFIPNQSCLASPGGMVRYTMTLDRSGQDRRYSQSLSKDNKILVVTWPTSTTLEIRIINNVLGKVIRKFSLTNPAPLLQVKMSQISDVDMNHLLLAGGNTIFIFHIDDGQIIKEFFVDENEDFSYEEKPPVSFADDEKLLVCLTTSSLRVWDVASGAVVHDIPLEETDQLDSVQQMLVDVADLDLQELLDSAPPDMMDEVREILKSSQSRKKVCIMHAKGKYAVYSIQGDNVVQVVDIILGKHVRKIETSSSDLWDIKLTSQDEIVIMYDYLLHVFNVNTGEEVEKVYISSSKENKHLVITDDGSKAVITQNLFRVVVIQELHREKSKQDIYESGRFVRVCSRDGSIIAAIGIGGVLRKYDITRPDDSHYDMGIGTSGISLSAAADNRHFVTVDSRTVCVWDALKGEKIRTITGNDKIREKIEYFSMLTNDGTRGVEYNGRENRYRVMDFLTGTLTAHQDKSKYLFLIGFIDDDRLLLISNCKMFLQVWDFQSGQVQTSLQFNINLKIEFSRLSFDRSTAVISLAENDKYDVTRPLFFIDTSSMTYKVCKMGNESLSLQGSAISFDGKYLISIHGNHFLIWNVPEVSIQYKIPRDKEEKVGTSPNSYHAVIVSSDLKTQIWNIETQEILHQLTFNGLKTSLCRETIISFNEMIALLADKTVVVIDRVSGTLLSAVTFDDDMRYLRFHGNCVMGVLPWLLNESVLIAKLHLPTSKRTQGEMLTSVFDGIPVSGTLKYVTRQ